MIRAGEGRRYGPAEFLLRYAAPAHFGFRSDPELQDRELPECCGDGASALPARGTLFTEPAAPVRAVTMSGFVP